METKITENYGRTNVLPVIPLRGKVAFPHVTLTFEVGRAVTLKAIEIASQKQDKLLFISTQRT